MVTFLQWGVACAQLCGVHWAKLEMPLIPSLRREKKIGNIPSVQYPYFCTSLYISKQPKNKDVVGSAKEQIESNENIYFI